MPGLPPRFVLSPRLLPTGSSSWPLGHRIGEVGAERQAVVGGDGDRRVAREPDLIEDVVEARHALDLERRREQTRAAADDGPVIQLVGRAQARLHVVGVRVPHAVVLIGQILIAADQARAEVGRGERHASRRHARVGRLRRRLDRARRREIEAAHVAVLRFRHAQFEVVADAEVQRQLVGHAPVVVDEHAVRVHRIVGQRARFDERRGDRQAQHEGRDALAVLAGRRRARARVRAVERVGAALPAFVRLPSGAAAASRSPS